MVIAFLSSPKLLHYTMPFVMLYLIIGTVAQKYIGLYAATQTWFSAPIIMLENLPPLPGFPIFLGLIFINLACKLIFKSPWHIQSSGIIITHIGAMMLLIGGLITALFSHEGFMDLQTNYARSYVEDYHDRSFVLLDEYGQIIFEKNQSDIHAGQTISLETHKLKIKVIETCRNCKISKRPDADANYFGMAQHMQLSESPARPTDEENMGGMTFMIEGSDNDGVYVTLEDVPRLPKIILDDQSYKFALRKKRRPLPFSIELLDFDREYYPGTEMAKSYSSHIRITDGDSTWESIVSMNEPLRYKGYNFYQSSFIATPQGDISVLAVVWNAGRTFPYIAGITMCLGLILHIILFRRRIRPMKELKA